MTGANTGIGKEVARILYSKNAAVWIAARNAKKGANAVTSIREAHPSSSGRLELLQLDLSDLTTIEASAEAFLAKEKRLDVLINNAGVSKCLSKSVPCLVRLKSIHRFRRAGEGDIVETPGAGNGHR